MVEAHLDSAGIPVNAVGLADCQFNDVWAQDAYDREVEGFAGLHPDFTGDDVRLMFQCLSGKVPVDMTEEDESRPGQTAGILSEALAYLKSLSITAPEWEKEVPEFISAAIDIKEANETQRSMAASLDATISALKTGFTELLAFFECDADAWTTANLSHGAAVLELARLVPELESLLDRVSGRPPARAR